MTSTEPLPAYLFVPPGGLPADVVFRPATSGDLRRLHEAFYDHHPYTQFRMQFQRLLSRQRDHRCFWLLAELESTLVGNGQLLIYPHGAELANLRVVEAFQNHRIGTAMIQVLMAIAVHIGLESLEIGVAENNPRAHALYIRLGFVVDRRLRLAGQEPAIILRKTL